MHLQTLLFNEFEKPNLVPNGILKIYFEGNLMSLEVSLSIQRLPYRKLQVSVNRDLKT